MQLVAYGVQDVYLTGNAQITYWKNVYRRHTNFACEPIEQTFSGSADFGKTVNCELHRNADLLGKVYVKVDIDAAASGNEFAFCRRLGHALIERATISVGGTNIEEQTGEWMNTWYELTRRVGQERGYAKMIGDVADLTDITVSKNKYTMYIPLQFWFCRNNGLALPLIALQYHDTRINIVFRKLADVLVYRPTGSGNISTNGTRTDIKFADAMLVCDYTYLDAEERTKFAQASHEYLIDVVQQTSEAADGISEKYRINFNHPSKALIWACKLGKYTSGQTFVDWATDGNWTEAKERFAKRVWLATRAALAYSSGWKITVADISNNTDEVSSPAVHGSLTVATTSPLYNLVSASSPKIDAQLVFADASGGAAANINNVVLLKNTVTMEDMSKTVAELMTGVTGGQATTTTQFLEDYGVVMRDWANTGLYVDGTENIVLDGKIKLNAQDRFQKRDGHYFNYVQPYQHWDVTPADGINCYSFALKPADHQPSGTCNFSRIDNTTLELSLGKRGATSQTTFASTWLGSDSNCFIFAPHYNVLRITSGMGGLAYSN